MSNILQRTISGIVLILITVSALLWNEYSMLTIISVLLVLAAFEIRKMFSLNKPELFIFVLFLSMSYLFFSYLSTSGNIIKENSPYFLAWGLSCIVLYYLFFSNTSVKSLGSALFNVGWVAVSLSFFVRLGWVSSHNDYSPYHMVVLLALIWINDICAYLIGSFLGKKALAPNISPNKTWEGFIGGIILSVGASILVFKFTNQYTIVFWIIAAFIVGLSATAGDLFESKLKREAGTKDSGNIIPGHGGILDRFDSLLFSAPLYFMFVSIWEKL